MTGEPRRPNRTNRGPSAAEVLASLAVDRYEFGVSTEGAEFAVPKPYGHVVRMLRGGQSSLRQELALLYKRETNKIPPQQALTDAMTVLHGLAQEATPTPVALRVAVSDESTVWVDLGDPSERVVCITPGGWSIVPGTLGARFRRTVLTAPFPTPEEGGTLADLWELLNVSEPDRPLVLAYMIAALIAPDIPHPILVLVGEQGTGKSTASRRIVALLDPSKVPLRKAPKDEETWVTSAAASWVVGLDNLSGIRAWFSDSLCRAVTGDGDARRALYTDGDLAVFAMRRVVLLNGIDMGAFRGDLAERGIVVNLDVIPDDERRTERELEARWQEAYPRLVGALLTEAAAVLSVLPDIRLAGAPRMADFAHILAGVDQRHGTDGLARYMEQAREMAVDTLESDIFLAALLSTLHEPFTGTAAELMTLVTPDPAPRDWPAARSATRTLKRNAPGLRKMGWTVDEAPRGRSSTLRWHLVPPVNTQPTSLDEALAARADRCSSCGAHPTTQGHAEGCAHAVG